MTELNALDYIVRFGSHPEAPLRALAERHLMAAGRWVDAAEVAADARAARATHELLGKSAREVLRAAVLLTAAVEALGSVLDDDRDALTEVERDGLLALVRDVEPRVDLLREALGDDLAGVLRRPAGLVLESAVDDGGHGSPSVGRPGLEPLASSGSSAGLPAIMDPTVGAPTDAPAVPSAVGASVERARTARVHVATMQSDLLDLDLQLSPGARRLSLHGVATALVDMGWHR